MTNLKKLACLALSGLLIVGSAAALAAEDASWTEDLQAARKASKASGKPILADFTGSDWCGFCIKQHKEVFETAKFQAWAKDNAILLTLDYPSKKKQDARTKKQNEEMKKQFNITGFPTVIFLTSDGKELGRFVGYSPGSGADKWIQKAQPIVDKGKKSGEKGS